MKTALITGASQGIGAAIAYELNNNKIKISIESQILLLVASRYEHYEKLILPLIKKGEIVISDRFQDSTFAYQCGNDKKLANMLKYLNQILLKNLEPNLYFIVFFSSLK